MNKSFYANLTLCKYDYKKGLYDYKLDKLNMIKNEKIYCLSDIDYIKRFIEYLKDNVIKRLPNINLVNIELNILDKSNILHRFIIKLTDIITKLLKIKLDINKSIIVCVKYDNNIVFTGCVNFTGL